MQEDPIKQSGGSGRQQEEGTKVVNLQEVGMSSPAIGDTLSHPVAPQTDKLRLKNQATTCVPE